ncbi:Hpt domain-containing protein [Vibrio tasmaniensis]|uniref:Hpt domain-containing protein n=1 Tax=Vibrio tasmaniensis TaxID=212663 RepID=UPI00107F05A3|nr:Hpt domain-containing protein [Vibrio tasmaniensis]
MLDIDALNAYLDNDREVIYAVLSTYQEDHENSLEEIQELVSQQDWGKLHFIVHTLKGILVSFGENTATVALENVEQNTLKNLAPQDGDLSIIYKEVAIINKQIEDALGQYC